MNAAPTIDAARPKRHWGEIRPKEPKEPELPQVPFVLRGGGIILNLPYDEAVERYGVWKCTILNRSSVYGEVLEPGDEAELTGDVVFTLVTRGDAMVADKRMREEADIINKAAELGLPQKIREIAAFAQPKKNRWSARLRESEPNE